jgi:hypothetical protein
VEITKEYFLEEYHRFRKIWGSTEYTLEQKDAAFDGFTLVYLNTKTKDDEEKEFVEKLYLDTIEEWERRRVYEMLKPLNDLIGKIGEIDEEE